MGLLKPLDQKAQAELGGCFNAIGAGSYFGDVSALLDTPATASVRAVILTMLYRCQTSDLKDLLRQPARLIGHAHVYMYIYIPGAEWSDKLNQYFFSIVQCYGAKYGLNMVYIRFKCGLCYILFKRDLTATFWGCIVRGCHAHTPCADVHTGLQQSLECRLPYCYVPASCH